MIDEGAMSQDMAMNLKVNVHMQRNAMLTMAKRDSAAKMQRYLDNKAERNVVAMKLLDDSGTGLVEVSSLVPRLVPHTPPNLEFLKALGLITECEALGMSSESKLKDSGNEAELQQM